VKTDKKFCRIFLLKKKEKLSFGVIFFISRYLIVPSLGEFDELFTSAVF